MVYLMRILYAALFKIMIEINIKNLGVCIYIYIKPCSWCNNLKYYITVEVVSSKIITKYTMFILHLGMCIHAEPQLHRAYHRRIPLLIIVISPCLLVWCNYMLYSPEFR
jgi:hypothetical protein